MLGVAGFIAYATATDFTGFLIGNILYYANWAFESGALSALLYDSMKENGRPEGEYLRTESKTFFWCTIGMATASVTGGFLLPLGLHVPYWGSVVVSVAELAGAFLFSEPALESRKITLRNYVRQNIDGARHIFANSKIRAVSVFSILINFTAYAGLWYLYEPRIAQAGFTGQLLGILVAGTYLIRAVGTKLIPAVLRR